MGARLDCNGLSYFHTFYFKFIPNFFNEITLDKNTFFITIYNGKYCVIIDIGRCNFAIHNEKYPCRKHIFILNNSML